MRFVAYIFPCCPTREVITIFIICFIFYFLFYANPLPSSIPLPLNLHNRQVDDCVVGEKEVLIEGVDVEVEAEEVAEDVGVGQKNYEELSLVALFDLLESPHVLSALRLFAEAAEVKGYFGITAPDNQLGPMSWFFLKSNNQLECLESGWSKLCSLRNQYRY